MTNKLPWNLLFYILLFLSCNEQKLAYDKYQAMNNLNPKPYLILDVLGKQWDWIFSYPNGQKISCHDSKYPDNLWRMKPIDKSIFGDLTRFVTIPVNQLIQLNLKSEKVLHSIGIPSFRLKKDAPVGKVASVQFTATKLGDYLYRCNEMCGIDHGTMIGYIRVVSQKEFDKFMVELKKR